MSLIKKTVRFDTLRLLKELIEVGEYNMAEFSRLTDNPSAILAHASLGRRKGHTTAIIEFAKSVKGEKQILILAPNACMANFINTEVHRDHVTMVQAMSINSPHLEKIGAELVIFDSVDLRDAYSVTHGFFTRPCRKPKAIVGLGLV